MKTYQRPKTALLRLFTAILLAVILMATAACGDRKTPSVTPTPSVGVSQTPSTEPTQNPSVAPTTEPTQNPSVEPSTEPTVTPSKEPDEVRYPADDYVHKYGDYEEAESWLSENIEQMYTPPVSFNYNGRSSAACSWDKQEQSSQTVVDFPTEARPSERIVRTVVYTTEDLPEIQVVVEFTTYVDYPVVEWNATIENCGDKDSGLLTNLLSFNHVIERADGVRYLHANRGSTISYTDFEPLTSLIKEDQYFEVTSGRGSTSTYIPYFNVENKVNNTGTVAIMSWQGQWKANFSETGKGVKLSAGQYETSLNLRPGESMRYPGAVLLFYKGNYENGQNVYRRWLYYCNLFREEGVHMEEKSAMFMGPDNDEAKDSATLRMYVETGLTDLLDRFNLDIGWEEGRVAGNWFANSAFPDGLKPLADLVHEAGLDFAVWFEPERIQKGTAMEEALKEVANGIIALDASGKALSDLSSLPAGTNMLINYAEEETVRYVIELLCEKILEYGIDHYRQDFNIDPQAFWKAQDAKYAKEQGVERVGYTENQYCTGYLTVLREVVKRNPGLYVDACASGGQRNDLDTVRLSYMHTRSDYWADIESAQLQTYGSSMWFLYWGTGFSSADLNSYDVRSHIGNSIGVGISKEEDAEKLANALSDWETFTPFLFYDYYPLTGYVGSTKKTAALQYDSPEKGVGRAIFYFRKDETVTVGLKGLDPAATYEIYDIDQKEATFRTATGQELAEGITVTSTRNTAVCYEYRLVAGCDTSAFQKATVETGPGSTDFDPSSIKTNGDPLENLTPPEVEAKYLPNGLSDEDLVEAYAAVELTEDAPSAYLGADYRSTGSLYAITKDIYDKLPLSGASKGEWKAINKASTGFILDGGAAYSWTVYNDWYWENQIFIREIGDAHFLWFSCIVGLSDSDGGWINRPNLQFTYPGGSFPLNFVCESSSMQRINQDGADSLDGKGKIFTIDEAIFGSFVYTGNGIYLDGCVWYEIDKEKIGIISVFQKTLSELADPLDYLVLFSEVGSKKVAAYASVDDEGVYRLWLRGYDDLPWLIDPRMSPVGRSLLCWYDKDGNLCQQTMVHR